MTFPTSTVHMYMDFNRQSHNPGNPR